LSLILREEDKTASILEQGTEENIWTKEGQNNRRMDITA
jgi:hypothetical protein